MNTDLVIVIESVKETGDKLYAFFLNYIFHFNNS